MLPTQVSLKGPKFPVRRAKPIEIETSAQRERGSAYENLAQNLPRKAGLTTGRLSIG